MSVQFANEMREAPVGSKVVETLRTGSVATYEKFEDGWRATSSDHPSWELFKGLGIDPSDVPIPEARFEHDKMGETLTLHLPTSQEAAA